MVPLHVVLAVHLLPADLPALPVVEGDLARRRRPTAATSALPAATLALPAAASAAPEAAAGGAAELPVAGEVARVAEALAAVLAVVAALVQASEIKWETGSLDAWRQTPSLNFSVKSN